MRSFGIFVPFRNEERFIGASARSLFDACIAFKKSYPSLDIKVVFINDGSVDDSEIICRRVIDYYNPNFHVFIERHAQPVGLSRSINEAFNKHPVDMLVRFDADDFCMVDRLVKQYEFFHSNSDVDVCGSNAEIIDEDDVYLSTTNLCRRHIDIVHRSKSLCPFVHPSVMIRGSVFQRAGGYDESFFRAQDYEFWLRLAEHGALFANIEDCLIRYRRKKNSTGWKARALTFFSLARISVKFKQPFTFIYSIYGLFKR